jgi:hypothetical protein
LFVEDVGFCEATKALSDAAADGFLAIRASAPRATHWGTAWSTAWLLPGASACDVWRWGTDGRVELRCDLGEMSPPIVARHAPLVLADLRACLTGDAGWSETLGPTHGAELPDVRRANATSGRAITLTTTCTEACSMSLVFE